ncbi:uncharacterized protein LOC34618398 [Cyclospora cayetanensis]|uniref:Uncharacterized protein LOC34618398 n=1 Tax=Cyclospora cayetanensis TaxID=88456 RepID=A0A6P6RUQ9_9EIME|nr:uncharacterized protein LOC34618398 [Cyclospora cayetanensis]
MEGPVGGPSEAASPDIDAEYPGASLLRLAVFLWFALFTVTVLIRYALLAQQQHLPGTISPGGPAATAAVAVATVTSAKDATRIQLFKIHVVLLRAVIREVICNFFGKCLVTTRWVLFWVLWKDKDGLEVYVHRDRISLKRATVLRRKTIVFIRHGESIWNLCFNRGVLTPEFPLRLFLLVLCELLLLWEFDSVLLDSPLSSLGIEQALSIRQVIASILQSDSAAAAEAAAAANAAAAADTYPETPVAEEPLRGPKHFGAATAMQHQQQDAESARVAALANALPDVQQQRVLLLTSNLRRASSTLLLAAGSVLACGKCSARETTRNPDGFPLAPALRVPSLSRLEIALMGCGGPMGGFPRASGAPPPRTAPTLAAGGAAVSSAAASGVGCVDPGGNRGPPSSSSRLWKRLLQFAEEAMGVQEETVIAVGHSRWIREFFRAFSLPEADLPASRRKLSNCGVLSLRLAQIQHEETGSVDYCIETESVRLLHGSFL